MGKGSQWGLHRSRCHCWQCSTQESGVWLDNQQPLFNNLLQGPNNYFLVNLSCQYASSVYKGRVSHGVQRDQPHFSDVVHIHGSSVDGQRRHDQRAVLEQLARSAACCPSRGSLRCHATSAQGCHQLGLARHILDARSTHAFVSVEQAPKLHPYTVP